MAYQLYVKNCNEKITSVKKNLREIIVGGVSKPI